MPTLGSLSRSTFDRIKSAADRYQRSRLALPILSACERRGTRVLFLTPDHDVPSGGIRVIYRHVDILNEGGIPAVVVHQRRGFRCSWFANETPVIDVAHATLGRQDILVLPEVDADLVARLVPGSRHVIFNQNTHLTWRRCADAISAHCETSRDLIGIMTVSDHNRDMLRYAYPALRVDRIRLGLDAGLFHSGGATKRRRITYMPRRGREDARQVLSMLQSRRALGDWEMVALDGLSHEEVGCELRTSRIFLAFTSQEGFGLPAAEAMACGNHVIGSHGFGGREFFDDRFCTPVESGDNLRFCQSIERQIDAFERDPEAFDARNLDASAFIRRTYSVESESEDVLSSYRSYLDVAAARQAASGHLAS